MKYIVLSVVLSLFINYSTSKTLPSFIQKCSLTKDFDECFVKHGNLALPNLLNGDKSLKLPSFNPLLIKEIVFAPSKQLKIIFTDFKVSGFENGKITRANVDLTKNTISYVYVTNKLTCHSKYNASGRILVLPIEGEGTSKTQMINPEFNITITFKDLNSESDEKLKLVKTDVIYKDTKEIHQFDNLFNGNKELGDNMNKFLNENDRELFSDFAPVYENVVETVVVNLNRELIESRSGKDVFLP